MTGKIGPGVSRHRLSNLLPTRNPERQTRYTIKAFRVLPRKGGDRKPANNDGFAGKTPRGTTNPLVYCIISKTDITPSMEMEKGICGMSLQEGKRRPSIPTRLGSSKNRNRRRSPKQKTADGPKEQEQNVENSGRTALPEKYAWDPER